MSPQRAVWGFVASALLALTGTGVALMRDPQPVARAVVATHAPTTTLDPLVAVLDQVSAATDAAVKACAP